MNAALVLTDSPASLALGARTVATCPVTATPQCAPVLKRTSIWRRLRHAEGRREVVGRLRPSVEWEM